MILQKCMTFWDYKREREKMKITKEDVLKIEHEIIGENMPWEKFDDNDYLAYLAIYTDGVNTMANSIIRKLEGKEG